MANRENTHRNGAQAKPRVLVADDEPSLRLLVSAVLDRTYDVTLVTDGDEAWQALTASPPDAAVLDIQMPGRSGLTLLADIRGHSRLNRLPVILLSARAQQADVQAGIAAGADAFVTKPFRVQTLLDELDRCLQGPARDSSRRAVA